MEEQTKKEKDTRDRKIWDVIQKAGKDTVLGMQTCSKLREKLAQIESAEQQTPERKVPGTKKISNNNNKL